MEIRQCTREELAAISFVEQEAGKRYAEIVCASCDFYNDPDEPFMPLEEFEKAFDAGVIFYGGFDADELTAFIGYRKAGDAALVRGLFVLPNYQEQGIGSELFKIFEQKANADNMTKIMLLAHKDASWAVNFYKKRGFASITENFNNLLKKYWSPLPKGLQCCADEYQMLIMQKIIG